MIKAESYTVKHGLDRTNIKIKVVTAIADDLKDIGEEILKAELVSIFK